jgi:hypothetical protein
MKQFVFEQRQKSVLFGLMGLGAFCLILSFFIDPVPVAEGHHLRFWTNLLHNATFFTGIAFTVTFALAATAVVYAGWHVAFKRVWEAMSLFLPIGLVCILIVGVAGKMGIHHIYHWMDDAAVASDKILSGKSSFLNFGFYLAAIGFGFVWYMFALKFRQFSLAQDESEDDATYPWYRKMKVWGGAFMPIAGFSSAAAIWLWLMSIDPHWYSTMYAWYTTASWWVSAVSITILMLIYLKSKGYFPEVTLEHIHDLGKFLFAFSVFWTYLWFSQYMLIWYANIGEETIYFRQRMGEFPVLFYGNIIMNFVLPFLILIRNDTKRKMGSLGFVAILVLFGHWWDFFQMVKIGPYKEAMAHHAQHSAAGHGDHKEATHAVAGTQVANEHAAAPANHAATANHDVAAGGHETPKTEGHAGEEMVQLHGGEHSESTGVSNDAHNAETAMASMSATEKLDATNEAEFFHYSPDMTSGYGMPGLIELGIFLGFGALFVFMVFSQLEKATLVPKKDPYLEETLHHHV